MSEHPHASLMREASAAFSRGDIDTLKQMIDEDVIWHVPGRSVVSGTYRGHEGLFGYFGRLMELSGGSFKVELHDVVASDEHVVNLDRLSGTREGKTLDIDLALVVHVRGGKIAEAWDLFSDQYAWDEFWS